MIKIPGYLVENILYESEKSLVYRAKKEFNQQSVILKILKKEYPSLEEIIRYKQEYQITKNLDLPLIIKAYNILKLNNTFIICFEDFGGISLDRIMKKTKISIKDFLSFAIKIVSGLKDIHKARIIHKDINPSNLVCNLTTKQVKIIDFGISSVLSRENTTLKNPNILEGTLNYISPEQTGRMNRFLDYRTDFYALGVTFYELLSQRLPFESDDPLDLINCHIAKSPMPLRDLNPEIPEILERIVMKLIAKDTEARYQSAEGLKLDLEECQRQWNIEKQISIFDLGKFDVSEQFQITQKLYGRELEISKLLNTFEKVSSQGKTKLMLISGYSGIGKSALVREIYKPITQAKGYFIEGKFDQYQRDIPYSAIVQAFDNLIEYLLLENESILKQWRKTLLEVLGINAGIIIELIPKIKTIIGENVEVSNLAASESKNRFNIVFQTFIKVLAQSKHPLIIFLDDLQWADSASLSLIQLIVTSSAINHLFLIGAYRNNEVSSTHPLMLTINEIEETETVIEKIFLSHLTLSDITNLIEYSLKSEKEKSKALGKLVLAKTNGNPFFINEFLRSLKRENLIYFDIYKQEWQWDIEKIKTQDITENVVELLSFSIKKLDPEIKEILKLASCIGNKFEIKLLANTAEKTQLRIIEILEKAIQLGVIFPIKNIDKSILFDEFQEKEKLQIEYNFSHDRVQQVVYSLISEKNKPFLHQKIGKILLQTYSSHLKENIFIIVNQLNLSYELIDSEEEIHKLAKFNLIAGKKAKSSGAYELGLKYLQFAVKLLEKDSWKKQYATTINIYLEIVEVTYLLGNFKEIELIAKIILEQAKTILEKIKVYEILIKFYTAQNKSTQVFSIGQKALKLLGVKLPIKQNKLDLILETLKIKLALRGKPLEKLVELPKMQDPYKLAAIRILSEICTTAYTTSDNLFLIITFKSINISLKYGNAPQSSFAYACYGLILCGKSNEIKTGYKFGRLSLNLLKKFEANEYSARTLFIINSFIKHWQDHCQKTLKYLVKAYNIAIEIGDIEYAAHSAQVYCSHSFFLGKNLPLLRNEIIDYNKKITHLKQKGALERNEIHKTIVLSLIEDSFSSSIINNNDLLNKLRKIEDNYNTYTSKFNFYLNKAIIYYLFEDYSKSIICLNYASKYLNYVKGLILVPIFYFYESLTIIILFSGDHEKYKYSINKVTKNQKRMKKWVIHAPMNYLHKYYLTEAEKNRIYGNKNKAELFYQKAIDLAKKNEYQNEEALGLELAGKFYLEWDKLITGKAHIKEAIYKYELWGASAKVKQLKEKYSQLLSNENIINSEVSNSTNISGKNTVEIKSDNINLAILVKTNKAISNEKDLDKLLEIILKYSLQVIGAQTGSIIISEGGKILIKGEAKLENEEIIVRSSERVSKTEDFPKSVINYVKNSQQTIVENNANFEGKFVKDPYIIKYQAKSILCLPLLSQGVFIGVIYLENNLATNAFKENDLGVLELITTQAAISIENALLKKTRNYVSEYYQLGGSLDAKARSYVIRDADRKLYENLISGHYCYILNARQMGKSSLRVKTTQQLRADGYKCALVDISSIGTEQITREEWYFSLIEELEISFPELKKIDLDRELDNISNRQSVRIFNYFIEKILLPNVKGDIIIFLEEIDAVRNLNFSLNDFFAQIRYLYNCRSDRPEFKRLTFVLIGAALSINLVKDPKITPFNIGTKIKLSGFKLENTQPLIDGIQQQCDRPSYVMEEILIWTGGQPFLTQRLCNLVKISGNRIASGKETQMISELVINEILDNWQDKDEREHLHTIQTYIINNEELSPIVLLELYKEILLSGYVIYDRDLQEHQELLVIGIAKLENNKIIIFNQIYKEVFNLNWVEKYLKNNSSN